MLQFFLTQSPYLPLRRVAFQLLRQEVSQLGLTQGDQSAEG